MNARRSRRSYQIDRRSYKPAAGNADGVGWLDRVITGVGNAGQCRQNAARDGGKALRRRSRTADCGNGDGAVRAA